MAQHVSKAQQNTKKEPQQVDDYRRRIGEQQEKVLHKKAKSPLTLDDKDKPVQSESSGLGKLIFLLFWIVLVFGLWVFFKSQSEVTDGTSD